MTQKVFPLIAVAMTFSTPAVATITLNPLVTVQQSGCISALGNCDRNLPNGGTFKSATGVSSATVSPPTASASFTGSSFSDSASVTTSGSFSVPTDPTGGTVTTSGSVTAQASEAGSSVIDAGASGVVTFTITNVQLSKPTYYQFIFTGQLSSGNNTLQLPWLTSALNNITNYSANGVLAAGNYTLLVQTGNTATNEGTCCNGTQNGSSNFSISWTLSETPIGSSSTSTDGPVPLWALIGLGGGLIAVASRATRVIRRV